MSLDWLAQEVSVARVGLHGVVYTMCVRLPTVFDGRHISHTACLSASDKVCRDTPTVFNQSIGLESHLSLIELRMH